VPSPSLTGELEHAVDLKIEQLVVLISRERTAEFQVVLKKHVGVGESVVCESRGTLPARADDRVRENQLG